MAIKTKNLTEKNIASNFIGQGWAFLVGMFAVPFYIRFIGIEGYGLVGFYGTLRVLLNSFLDFGLTVTIKREIAQYAASPSKKVQIPNLVRTLEVIYWVIGLFLSLLIFFSASVIAKYWINSESIPISLIEKIVMLMGIIIFLQWPLTLYQGGLIGLQKIVLLNGINITITTLRGVGGILAVWLFSPPIFAFFVWQIVLSLFNVSLTRYLLWKSIPKSKKAPSFQKSIIKDVWKFAVGMGGNSFFSFFLNQIDKIVLSKILSLEDFGYYSLAVTLNEQVKMIAPQIIQPLFPRFSALIFQKDENSLKKLYHKASQLVSIIILTIAGTSTFFSYELIYLWTGDVRVATIVSPIASLLFAGTALSNLIDVPFNLTIAYGWVKLPLYRSIILSALAVPMVIILSIQHGGIGAALAWVIINLVQLLILPWIIHKKILATELKQWLIFDTGIPVIILVIILSFSRLFFPSTIDSSLYLPMIGIITVISLLTLTLSSKEARVFGKNIFQKTFQFIFSQGK